MDKPITEDTEATILFCSMCGHATTKLEAISRIFYTGYSGCCNNNLLERPPRYPYSPRVYMESKL